MGNQAELSWPVPHKIFQFVLHQSYFRPLLEIGRPIKSSAQSLIHDNKKKYKRSAKLDDYFLVVLMGKYRKLSASRAAFSTPEMKKQSTPLDWWNSM